LPPPHQPAAGLRLRPPREERGKTAAEVDGNSDGSKVGSRRAEEMRNLGKEMVLS
jgi:hypothetical protein